MSKLRHQAITVLFVCLCITEARGDDRSRDATAALTDRDGRVVLGVGVAYLNHAENSDDMLLKTPFESTIPGSGTSIDNRSLLGVCLTYYFHSSWGAEIYLGTPTKLILNGHGTTEILGKYGTVKPLPVVFDIVYSPFREKWRLQPYIGIGFNYMKFSNIDIPDGLESRLRDLSAIRIGTAIDMINPKLHIENSKGLLFKAGLDYELTPKIRLSVSAMYLNTESVSQLTTESIVGPIIIEQNTKVATEVYFLGFGYQFD